MLINITRFPPQMPCLLSFKSKAADTNQKKKPQANKTKNKQTKKPPTCVSSMYICLYIYISHSLYRAQQPVQLNQQNGFHFQLKHASSADRSISRHSSNYALSEVSPQQGSINTQPEVSPHQGSINTQPEVSPHQGSINTQPELSPQQGSINTA